MPINDAQILSLQTQINDKLARIKAVQEIIAKVKADDASGYYPGHTLPAWIWTGYAAPVAVATFVTDRNAEITTLLADLATLRTSLKAFGNQYVI